MCAQHEREWKGGRTSDWKLLYYLLVHIDSNEELPIDMGSHNPEITYNAHVLICSTGISKTVEYGATK